MILKDIERQILRQQQDAFIYPQYEGYCFSNIPATVQYLFGNRITSPLSPILDKAGITPTKQQKVVALLLDAFGWNQWMRYADQYEFLKRLTERGVLAPLTSIFPSTTPVALTTIHSGLTPQEHGLPDAWVYFEELQEIVTILQFKPIDGDKQDQLLESGVDPAILFNRNTLYEALGESGVPSYSLIHDVLKSTAYCSVTMKGSKVVPFIGAPGLMKALYSQLTEVPSPAYFYAYWGLIDIAAHNYGVHSEQYLTSLELILNSLQKEFLEKLPADVADETVLLVFADHGQINIEPRDTIHLNRFGKLMENLRTGHAGEKIRPWGNVREIFLAVEEGKLDETIDYLKVELEGKARVLKSEEALKDGLFGHGELHSRFESRIGDILLLPERNLGLWYEQPHQKEFPLLGTHGGLSPDEMLVPFAAARISDLQ